MSKEKHNISIDGEVIEWLNSQREADGLALSTIINMKLRRMMLRESDYAAPTVAPANVEPYKMERKENKA